MYIDKHQQVTQIWQTISLASDFCHRSNRSHSETKYSLVSSCIITGSLRTTMRLANVLDDNEVCCRALVISCSNNCNMSLSHTTYLHLMPCHHGHCIQHTGCAVTCAVRYVPWEMPGKALLPEIKVSFLARWPSSRPAMLLTRFFTGTE
jgi:hypothetical protein